MDESLKPGLYEQLITRALSARAAHTDGVDQRPLGEGESSRVLARHLGDYLRAALEAAAPDQRATLINHVLDTIDTHVEGYVQPGDRVEAQLLTAVCPGPGEAPPRPHVALSEAELFVNARNEPKLGSELRKELASADRVDLICAFLFWTGYVTLRDQLRAFTGRGGKLRVISTPYRGVTEPRVLQDLADLGAEVRVAYDAQTTRLHAKAWLFHRESGFSTAYVGSSNLSKSALSDGLEWNVRLSAIENRAVLEKFRATFNHYWRDPEFAPFDREKFVEARRGARGSDALRAVFQLRPRPFQQGILDALRAEREVHNRHRNLVVAATGTGKTVVAALDYAQTCDTQRPTLLFVAHRREILLQARDTFRHAVSDPSFGELLVGGEEPVHWRYVFASVQSLRTHRERFAPDHFQHVVIDEFHHAPAQSYRALLNRLQPRELVGLTATPERTDGFDVKEIFGGRVAAEIRLWDAIDRGLLVPFQYFVRHDGVDLSGIKWSRGRYDPKALEAVYTGHDVRAHQIQVAVAELVADPMAMRALGFCVGIAHAEYMARAFERAGIPAAVVQGSTKSTERDALIAALQGDAPDRPRVLFTVDVFNEGVDLPAVDTLLFLRPTESATLFLQQLGRGLRRWAGKRCLTVLDFVGKPRREFRFDRKLRAITGGGRRALKTQVEHDFPFLPAGCSLQLDRQSREIVLESLRQGIGADRRSLVAELRSLGDVDLATFLAEAELELDDIYRNRSFTDLRRAAELPTPPAGPDEDRLGRAIGRLIHVDDVVRLDTWLAWLDGSTPPRLSTARQRRLALMLATSLFGATATGANALEPLWAHPALRAELVELLQLRRDTLDHVSLPFASAAPLAIHAHYSRKEVMAAFDDVRKGRLYEPREGVVFLPETRHNLLFVTLRKDEADFSPSTMYRDYALSPDRFHWQSQSRTRPTGTKGRRHVEHARLGVTPLLFVRATQKDERGANCPFAFLGPVTLAAWSGERPMNVEWQLDHPMNEALFRQARVVAS